MNKLEYIPGDLVMYQGKVTTVRECRGNYYVLNCQHSIEDAVYYTDLKPVQLTPKILKKNGWERNGGDSYLKYSLYRVFFDVCHVYTLKHYEGSTSKYFDFISKDSKCCYKSNIMYCHQLQHLLFGLGLPMDLKV